MSKKEVYEKIEQFVNIEKQWREEFINSLGNSYVAGWLDRVLEDMSLYDDEYEIKATLLGIVHFMDDKYFE